MAMVNANGEMVHPANDASDANLQMLPGCGVGTCVEAQLNIHKICFDSLNLLRDLKVREYLLQQTVAPIQSH